MKKDYIRIFRLKEKRAVFYEEDLIDLMKWGGFKNVKLSIVYLKKMSVRNWLESSGLVASIQEKIYRLHKYAPDYFKHDYNMFEVGNDCLIDMKMAILVGKK